MIAARLGVNIDHVATLRNARGSPYPDPLRAARVALEAGADGITAHLREDRRHIRDEDIARLAREPGLKLNLEMAATPEMVDIALRVGPYACCVVPEKREEITTEGGLDAAAKQNELAPLIRSLRSARLRVSLFIDPDETQLTAAAALGADDVEFHTGAYAEAVLANDAEAAERQIQALRRSAREAARLGLEAHAGHGVTYDNIARLAAIPEIVEFQIGHFLVGEAIFLGLGPAIRKMRGLIDGARAGAPR